MKKARRRRMQGDYIENGAETMIGGDISWIEENIMEE
jgi:hypothetical protein